MIEYCPNCDDDTEHREIEDDYLFDYAVQCLECGMVWEADSNVHN